MTADTAVVPASAPPPAAKPWSSKYPELAGCRDCGTTERPHYTHGRCRPRAERERWRRPGARESFNARRRERRATGAAPPHAGPRPGDAAAPAPPRPRLGAGHDRVLGCPCVPHGDGTRTPNFRRLTVLGRAATFAEAAAFAVALAARAAPGSARFYIRRDDRPPFTCRARLPPPGRRGPGGRPGAPREVPA
ncbi:MAG TPA: hypothetical protein VFL91_10280 [Thermomicrobiales bacterium]|nr:hypothetical protein [Thermomicrobiales bacterium]